MRVQKIDAEKSPTEIYVEVGSGHKKVNELIRSKNYRKEKNHNRRVKRTSRSESLFEDENKNTV